MATAKKKEMACFFCQAVNPASAKYCSNCGSRLDPKFGPLQEVVAACVRAEVEKSLEAEKINERALELTLTEKVVTRLMDWAKLFGVFVGVLVAVAGYLGIKAAATFSEQTAIAQKTVETQKEAATKEIDSARVGALVEIKGKQEKARALDTEYRKLQDDMQKIAANVQDLNSKLVDQGSSIDNLHDQLQALRAQALPAPPGQAPYRLSLDTIIGADANQAILKSGRLVFQTVGDTGGVQNSQFQTQVAEAMTKQVTSATPGQAPAFLYLLGNITYFYGAAEYYYAQFYRPYEHYPLPIFAIPGNHDGLPYDPGDSPFSNEDFLRAPELIEKLQAKSDPVSAFLFDHLTEGTKALLRDPTAEVDTKKSALVWELNTVLLDPLYIENRFAQVQLTPRTRQWLASNPSGSDLEKLNRYLLEDAYPSELKRTPEPGPSLAAFVENFCSKAQRSVLGATRTTMTQPNVYWTLEAPYATIIGLATNTPTGGYIDKKQADWLTKELREAPRDKAIILTMHHSVYTGADSETDEYDGLKRVLEKAKADAGRGPDLVLSAHAHCYIRYMKDEGDRQIPYIVAGTGGYFRLFHKEPSNSPASNVKLASHDGSNHGFLRITVDKQKLIGEFFTTAETFDHPNAGPVLADRFEVSLVKATH